MLGAAGGLERLPTMAGEPPQDPDDAPPPGRLHDQDEIGTSQTHVERAAVVAVRDPGLASKQLLLQRPPGVRRSRHPAGLPVVLIEMYDGDPGTTAQLSRQRRLAGAARTHDGYPPDRLERPLASVRRPPADHATSMASRTTRSGSRTGRTRWPERPTRATVRSYRPHMGFTYRRSVRLLPGVRLNVSGRGVGVSAGSKRVRYSSRSGARVRLPGGFTWRGKR